MKNLKLLFIIILCITFSCKNKKKEKASETVVQVETINKKIEPAAFKEKVENGEVQLIDVRTPKEFAKGYIKGAKNINFYDDNFLQKMSALDKSQPIYVYCKAGGRSGSTAQKLAAEGFTQIYDLKGGFLAWEKEIFNVERRNN